MAVGSASLTFGSRPLAESWNGTTWTVVPTPRVGERNAGLSGVSCPGPSNCMAVGWQGTLKHPTQGTLAESWDGTAWKVVPTPFPRAPGGTALNGVSCTTARRCMAVGYSGYQAVSGNSRTLAESWNGKKWQPLPTPNPGGSGSLAGVACTAASSCMAVGIRAEHLPLRLSGTLSEQWNGSSWAARPSPDAGGANFDEFDGAACISRAACIATGDGTRQTGETTFTVAASWNGTNWGLLRSPSPGGTEDGLLGVSCTSSSSCMAVGDAEGFGNDHTLAEAWNGTGWRVIPTPPP